MKKTLLLLPLVIIIVSGCGNQAIKNNCANGICDVTEKQSSSPYYFITVHNEPNTATDKNYEVLKDLVEYADNYNMKLTLMFSAQWADFFIKNQDKMQMLQEWQSRGHEIAAHHHSITHPGGWDGFSDYSINEIQAARKSVSKEQKYATDQPSQGSMDDFIKKLQKINPNITSGCMNGDTNPLILTDSIIYATCAGGKYPNFGEAPFFLQDSNPRKGKNEYIVTIKIDDIKRYYLSHGQVLDATQKTKAIQTIRSMQNGVYGTVVHSNPRETPHMKEFMDYVHAQDPSGSRSKTISEVIEEGLLPEKNEVIK